MGKKLLGFSKCFLREKEFVCVADFFFCEGPKGISAYLEGFMHTILEISLSGNYSFQVLYLCRNILTSSIPFSLKLWMS